MHAASVLALGALVGVAAAKPMQHQHHQHLHHRRDTVWVTALEEEIVIVPVTVTVTVLPGEPIPTQANGPDWSLTTTTVLRAPTETPAAAEATTAIASTSAAAVTTQAPAPAPTTTSVSVVPAATSSSAPVAQQQNVALPAGIFDDSDVGSLAGLESGLAASGTAYSGDFTNFTPGLGACGFTNTSSQAIVAISHVIFDSYTSTHDGSNGNPVCGRSLTIYGWNGTSIQAEVVDRCPVCDEGALDMSINLFNYATNTGDGRVHNMKWKWN